MARMKTRRWFFHVDSCLQEEDRQRLWHIISQGALPYITVTGTTDIASDTWVVESRDCEDITDWEAACGKIKMDICDAFEHPLPVKWAKQPGTI